MKTAAIVGLLVTGCSFIGVRGPLPLPTPHKGGCTDSQALPVVDAVVSALVTVMTIAAVASLKSQQNRCHARDLDTCAIYGLGMVPVVAVGLPAAITYGISAQKGFDKVGQCRAAPEHAEVKAEPAITAPPITPAPATPPIAAPTPTLRMRATRPPAPLVDSEAPDRPPPPVAPMPP